MNLPPQPKPARSQAGTTARSQNEADLGAKGMSPPELEPGEEPERGSPKLDAANATRLWRIRRGVAFRLILLLLSAGGMVAALLVWLAGHGEQAARVLAGDVLLIFLLLVTL